MRSGIPGIVATCMTGLDIKCYRVTGPSRRCVQKMGLESPIVKKK